MVDTVVNSSTDPGPTRLPIWALAIPAIPSTGEVILVKLRFSCAFSTAAWAPRILGLGGNDVRLGEPRNGCLCCIDSGTGRQLHADRIIQVLLAHCVLFSQRPDARQIGFGSGPACVLQLTSALAFSRAALVCSRAPLDWLRTAFA